MKPEDYLVTHRAQPDVVERAILRARPEAPAPRWAYAAALAAVFLLGTTTGLLAARVSEAPAEAPAVATLSPTAEAATGVPVRLVFREPAAQTVSVAGSWNAWALTDTPMTRAPDGTFHTVVILPPGRHEYMFVVDGGSWVSDPLAELHTDDGFGHRNAVLEI